MGEEGPGGGEGHARLSAGERRIVAGESAGARQIRCLQGKRTIDVVGDSVIYKR